MKYFLSLDTIGVCKGASDLQELTARNTGKLLKKREVTLVDQSGAAVCIIFFFISYILILQTCMLDI